MSPAPPAPPPPTEGAASAADSDTNREAAATRALLPPGLLASSRVESFEVIPRTVELTRGDTVNLRVIFRDARGDRVAGVRWGVTDDPAMTPAHLRASFQKRATASGSAQSTVIQVMFIACWY